MSEWDAVPKREIMMDELLDEIEEERRAVRKARQAPKSRAPEPPRGALNTLILHCQNTCKAQRKKRTPWTAMEGAVRDVMDWLGKL
jgi:hypothetical protein